MTAPVNMALYRLLVKRGATEAEAEEAARLDASELATKADLAELKAEVHALKWMFGVTWALLVLILGAVLQLLLRGTP